MPTPFIEVQNLTKRFGKKVVLENVTFSIPHAEIFGVIGTNGSGKTTLLKLLVGFYEPEKGSVLFQSRNVLKDLENVKNLFGYATQENCFYVQLTVKENLEYFGSLYNIHKDVLNKNIQEILGLVSLKDAENVIGDHLSTGMQRRLDIAISLIHNPQVLILDEPTEDLDPLLRNEISTLIKKIKNNGTTVVLTTQLLEEMDKICDKIAILHNKKIIDEYVQTGSKRLRNFIAGYVTHLIKKQQKNQKNSS